MTGPGSRAHRTVDGWMDGWVGGCASLSVSTKAKATERALVAVSLLPAPSTPSGLSCARRVAMVESCCGSVLGWFGEGRGARRGGAERWLGRGFQFNKGLLAGLYSCFFLYLVRGRKNAACLGCTAAVPCCARAFFKKSMYRSKARSFVEEAIPAYVRIEWHAMESTRTDRGAGRFPATGNGGGGALLCRGADWLGVGSGLKTRGVGG